MRRRIFGLENEYGVTCRITGEGKLSPDEVARYLFRRVVSWGRSSNVFLTNGARLYLDVGSHPEYATPECDSVRELIIHDRAGERILEDLAVEAQERIDDEGIEGQIYLFKNNTDSAGNSYGCHENYLIGRSGEFSTFADIFIPFLISRQIVTGAGKVLPSARGSSYCVSQRAEHIWEGLSSATTRSRPIINTRDEPHADAELYRRLHVIVGDSNMSECTNMLKVGSAELVLQMIEAGVAFRDMSLENSIRAIREISSDTSGTQTVKLASGLDVTALDMQEEYFSKAATFVVKEGINDPNTRLVMDLWGRSLQAIRSQNLQDIGTEIDWVIKKLLMERFMERDSLDWNSPRLAQLDLAYHDINRQRGLFYLLERKGLARRLLNDSEIEVAKALPPQSTRAKLRGDFISAAQEKKRDFTVDWVHLKLNDQAQRTVLCKDPFLAVDERVDRLIASM